MITCQMHTAERRAAMAAVATTLAALITAVFSTSALGHHAAAVTYHTDQVIEVEGEITRLLWRNPHIRFTVTSTDRQDRATEWEIESIPVTRLNRVGVPADVVRVGQAVTVAGFPSRRPENALYAINMLLPDGRELLLDTPVARWTSNTIGTGRDETPGARGADPELGIFRVWSTDDSRLSFNQATGPLTDAARADMAAWDPLSLDNPFRGCTPKGMPTIMSQPNPIEFVDEGDRIVLRMEEFDTVRVIFMTPEASGGSIAANHLGHSIGRWEGGTLVVETDRINWRNFSQNGLLQSEAMELVERFTPSEDGSRLEYEITITDPALFTEPVTLTKSWVWVPGDQVLPFNCTER